MNTTLLRRFAIAENSDIAVDLDRSLLKRNTAIHTIMDILWKNLIATEDRIFAVIDHASIMECITDRILV